MIATDGTFNLFDIDPDDPSAKRMEYRMRLTTREGDEFELFGFKRLRHANLLHLWPDSTTLYCAVRSLTGRLPGGVGILRISPADFIRQLATIEVTNARSDAERLELLSRFGTFFASTLFSLYGAVAGGTSHFGVRGSAASTPDAPRSDARAVSVPNNRRHGPAADPL